MEAFFVPSKHLLRPLNTDPFKETSSRHLSSLKSTISNKDPWNKFFENAVESTIASLMDYVLMQPKREIPAGMRRVSTQFIAALGDPNASSSLSSSAMNVGADEWGIWTKDPGPRGIPLSQFNGDAVEKRNNNNSSSSSNKNNNYVAPHGWVYDPNDFWIEEYGRIMERPNFPLANGRYLVTGGRSTTAILHVSTPNANGRQEWKLTNQYGDDDSNNSNRDITLRDVTHLPCRSARYKRENNNINNSSSDKISDTHRNDGHSLGTPAAANKSDFPVYPGGEMPSIPGCTKQDYAILFVIAVDQNA